MRRYNSKYPPIAKLVDVVRHVYCDTELTVLITQLKVSKWGGRIDLAETFS